MSKPLTTSETKANQWAFFDKAKHMISGGNNRYFLQTLVRYANNENSCWRTVETLAFEMGIGEKTVRRAIKCLEDLNLIMVIRKRSREGRSHPNVYVLNMDNKQVHAVTTTGTQSLDKVTVTSTQALDTVTVTDTHQLDVVTMTDTSDLEPVTMTGACGQLPKNEAKKTGDAVTQSTEIRSHSPRDAVTVTGKYKVNINNNINTGVESKLTTSEDLFLKNDSFPKAMDYWFFIKTKIKNDFNKFLPSTPSEQDFEAMEYLEGIYDIDMNIRYNWQLLYKFVIERLGEPEATLNPAVRLMLATDAHPQKDLAFVDALDKFDFMPVDEDEALEHEE